MKPEAKKKYTMAIGVIAVVIGAAVGVFRAVGCEKGAEITETVGDVVEVITPDNLEAAGGADGAGGAAAPEGEVIIEEGEVIVTD